MATGRDGNPAPATPVTLAGFKTGPRGSRQPFAQPRSPDEAASRRNARAETQKLVPGSDRQAG